MSEHILKFREIETLWGAFQMQKLRNECREFMTHDTSHISMLQQMDWFYKTYRVWHRTGVAKAYLAYWEKEIVGYGLIRNLNTTPVLSGGLSGKYRGMGFGEQLFAFLLKQAGKKTVILDVRKDNLVARSLYKKLGFQELYTRKGIVYMEKHE